MRKRFLNACLYSALFLSIGTFGTACDDDDNASLENRVSVLEGLIDGIKEQLSKAIMVGSSVTNWDADSRLLTLSDGTVIDLGSLGGGEASNIVVRDGVIIITIDGKEYVLPLATTIRSLVFCPSSTNSIVEIPDNETNTTGVKLHFLATPSISSEALANAKVSIADAREVSVRANANFFTVKDLKADGDLLEVTVRAWDAEPNKTYTVALMLQMPGISISSNYFYIKIGNLNVVTEDLSVDPTLAGLEGAMENPDGSWTATLPDGNGAAPAFLSSVRFQDLIKVEGQTQLFYSLAPKSEQNEEVQANYDNLSSNLANDGTWTCNKRPGTAGGETGILLVAKDAMDIVRAKVHIKVIDPLADVNFQALCGINGNFEAELYGRDGRFVDVGKQTLDLPALFASYETEIPIRHGDSDAFFAAYAKYVVKSSEGDLLYNDGSGQLVMSDILKKYTVHSRGVFWFYRGFQLVVPETICTDGKFTDENGTFSGGEGYAGYDCWGSGNPADYANNPNFYQSFGNDLKKVGDFGWIMDEKTGELTTPADYTGYGLRMSISAGLEYAYGVKSIVGNGTDQFGMLFFNRRTAPEGATMPSLK